MELISQHVKRIMENCKVRARAVGLKFDNETLEYIVTNRDLINLMPKHMVPTIYDYWVHDVEVLRERGKYELSPGNPYESVINTRPAISFYNDNNPDWLNTMIFYHVLGHIDFFQNNFLFKHTWFDDFAEQAAKDKEVIEKHRAQHGRWVDYVIEFSRNIDNLVSFYKTACSFDELSPLDTSEKVSYYFDIFLQDVKTESISEYLNELDRYNADLKIHGSHADEVFFAGVLAKHSEFNQVYAKFQENKKKKPSDLFEYLIENSAYLNRIENEWMLDVMHIVRNTSMYFQPQIRTKIFNEGWASYWHETLFLQDLLHNPQLKGNETNYAVINAGVTSLSRVGLNPYAIGLRLIKYIEDMADKGKISHDFQKIQDRSARAKYDMHTGKGREFIFQAREFMDDFNLINTFVDQDFCDMHDLFVAASYIDEERGTEVFYVKSRKAKDYKQMLIDNLYHPPKITIDQQKSSSHNLYLVHSFEGRQLVQEYIPNTMMGIGFLWGGSVQLETHEIHSEPTDDPKKKDTMVNKVVHTMSDERVYSKKVI
ncbi:SpoVR family protein [Candidatus Woesearchaeota archaeon]|nr:SpoVR family protein [Candidatus Woesearchaeota archaeon]